MSTSQIRDQFLDEISNIRKAYPMVHIGTWTPDDFHLTENGPNENGDRGEADWNAPLHPATARELGRLFEEGAGQFWIAMRRAITKARDEHGKSM